MFSSGYEVAETMLARKMHPALCEALSRDVLTERDARKAEAEAREFIREAKEFIAAEKKKAVEDVDSGKAIAMASAGLLLSSLVLYMIPSLGMSVIGVCLMLMAVAVSCVSSYKQSRARATVARMRPLKRKLERLKTDVSDRKLREEIDEILDQIEEAEDRVDSLHRNY